jgi:hypothetical protein
MSGACRQCQATRRQKSQAISRGQQPEKCTTSALLPKLLQATEFQTPEELLDAVVRILTDIPLETLMAIFHEWLQRLQAALTVMENMSDKHSLIQKTSVEFQRETEMLRGGLNTLHEHCPSFISMRDYHLELDGSLAPSSSTNGVSRAESKNH